MKSASSGNSKIIPENLNDCLRPDGISSALWAWSGRTLSIGKGLLFLVIVFGIINTVSVSITTYSNVELTGDEDAAAVATVFAVLTELLVCAAYAFVTYGLSHIVSLLVSAAASLVRNTNVSTNLALYGAKKKTGNAFVEEAPKKKEPPAKHTPEPVARTVPLDPQAFEEEFVDVVCPNCYEALSFLRDTQSVVCPSCSHHFDLPSSK